MKLYHGSNMEIDKPDLSRSKPFKDFGQGFYLSPGYEQAHALAKQKTDQLQSGENGKTDSGARLAENDGPHAASGKAGVRRGCRSHPEGN